MARRGTCLADSTKGFERIGVVDFLQFQEIRIFPVGVSIISIEPHCLLMVTRNFYPKLDIRYIPSLLSLDSLGEAVHILGVFHIAAELLPFRIVDEFIIMCILGKVYWVIATHH